MTSTRSSTRQPAAARRRAREREILLATRELFDETGVRDAQIEDIARAVGVNRAIIYRHFSGKEELFALTLVSYLEDLEQVLTAAAKSKRTPTTKLVAVVEAFVDFGVEYPAFVDCAQTLMRRPGPELLEEISESSLFRLGRGISACLTQLSDVLDAGVASRRLRRTGLDAAGQPHVRQRPRRPPARPRRHAREGVSARASRRSRRSRPNRSASSSWPRPSRWPWPPRTDTFSLRRDRRRETWWLLLEDRGDALAAGGADRDQAAAADPFSLSSLARLATIRPPVAANG